MRLLGGIYRSVIQKKGGRYLPAVGPFQGKSAPLSSSLPNRVISDGSVGSCTMASPIIGNIVTISPSINAGSSNFCIAIWADTINFSGSCTTPLDTSGAIGTDGFNSGGSTFFGGTGASGASGGGGGGASGVDGSGSVGFAGGGAGGAGTAGGNGGSDFGIAGAGGSATAASYLVGKYAGFTFPNGGSGLDMYSGISGNGSEAAGGGGPGGTTNNVAQAAGGGGGGAGLILLIANVINCNGLSRDLSSVGGGGGSGDGGADFGGSGGGGVVAMLARSYDGLLNPIVANFDGDSGNTTIFRINKDGSTFDMNGDWATPWNTL